MTPPLRLLFIGPPGAGKGTQARRVAEGLGVPHIASGDLLREAIRAGTPLGLKAKEYMDRGELVPDDLMIGFISDRIEQRDARAGFVLDGFPRTLQQARALDAALAEGGIALDGVLHLEVPDELIVERLAGRRTCPTCQRAYHMLYDAPKTDERCDDDGAALTARPDDAPDTIRRRLEVYNEATSGLLSYYEDGERLVTVDGVGYVEDVAERIDKAIEALS